MTALDFSDKEPALKRARVADVDTSAGNAAIYQRLQGQTKKKGIERYGWVALPVGAVAIIGLVALTSTPHQSKDHVVGAPGQQTATVSKSAPVMAPKAVASNDAVTAPHEEAADQVKANIQKGLPQKASLASASPSTAAPAPIKTARAAPAKSVPGASDVRPAAAAPAQRTQQSDAQLNAGQLAAPAPAVTPPAPSATATPTAPAAAAPVEATPAPSVDSAAPVVPAQPQTAAPSTDQPAAAAAAQ